MPLLPRTYRFKCPMCKVVCKTTHLHWHKVPCIECGYLIDNNEIKLLKGKQ